MGERYFEELSGVDSQYQIHNAFMFSLRFSQSTTFTSITAQPRNRGRHKFGIIFSQIIDINFISVIFELSILITNPLGTIMCLSSYVVVRDRISHTVKSLRISIKHTCIWGCVKVITYQPIFHEFCFTKQTPIGVDIDGKNRIHRQLLLHMNIFDTYNLKITTLLNAKNVSQMKWVCVASHVAVISVATNERLLRHIYVWHFTSMKREDRQYQRERALQFVD